MVRSYYRHKCLICKDKSVEKVESLFQFPKSPERREKWISNLKLRPEEIKKSAVVCKAHFKKSQYVRHRLKKDAIPTIPFPLEASNRNNDNRSSRPVILSEGGDGEPAEKVNHFVPFRGATLPMVSAAYAVMAKETPASTSSSTNLQQQTNQNSPSSSSSCVVCHRSFSLEQEIIQSKFDLRTRTDLEFLLRNILGFSNSSLEEYKEQFGALQKWISLCSRCLDVIKEGKQIQQQISQLEKHLLARKNIILEKVMDIYYSQGGKDHSETLEKIRKLVDSYLKAQGPRQKEKEQPKSTKLISLQAPFPSSSSYPDAVKDEDRSTTDSEGSVDNDDDKNDEDYIDCNDLQMPPNEEMDEGSEDPLKADENDKEVVIPVVKKNRQFGFRYNCPNCPQVKSYLANRYAQHLGIHQKRPFKCSECFEFLPMEEYLREQHWKDKHSDKQPASLAEGEDKFIEIKFDAGKIFKCDGCWIGFNTSAERNRHESKCKSFLKNRKELEGKRLLRNCITCEEEKTFRNKEEWRFHRLILHPEVDALSCFHCDLSFAEKTADSGIICRNDIKLKEHCKTEHTGRDCVDGRIRFDECDLCGIVFGGGGGGGMFPPKKAHIAKTHGLPENEAYSCRICQAKFKYSKALWEHIQRKHFPPPGKNRKMVPLLVPTRKQCSTSKNENKEKANKLKLTSSTSSSSAPFICDICGGSFKKSINFQHHKYVKHGVIQEGATIYTCSHSGCDYKSVIKCIVTTHFKSRHTSTYEIASRKYRYQPQPTQCDLCGNFYSTRQNLRLHMEKIHDSNRPEKPPISLEFDPSKPFRCKYCSKAFINRSRVLRHEQIHENKDTRPFRCEVCFSSFAVMECLRIHKRLHCVSGGWKIKNLRKTRRTRHKNVERKESSAINPSHTTTATITVSSPNTGSIEEFNEGVV